MAASKSIALLNQLALEEKRLKFPNIPSYALTTPSFKENDTNNLTKSIIEYITLIGGYAVRINTQGQWNEKIQQWTKSTTRKGTADIHACIKGRHYSIEVKTGKDTMSDEQIETRNDVIKSGGVYIMAKCLDDVVNIIK